MAVFGFILILVGCAVGLVGELRFLVITYRHGWAWFFTCLFIPFVGWMFFLFYTRASWRPVVLSTGGFLVAGLGCLLGGFDLLH